MLDLLLLVMKWDRMISEGAFLIMIYHIVVSASPSRFEAHVGLFRLLMKGIFDPYIQ